jgi:2,4-dienoyl-CoA reductase-like NADH-dependent reductase (Old Yellow Enzyme family)
MLKQKYEPLFEPFVLCSGVKLKNRIIMAPMTNWSSNNDGTVSDAELDYYVRRAGGVGMVITACTYVTPSGKGFHGEFAGDCDEMIPSLRRLASAIKESGAKAVLQIFHVGRLCPPDLVPNGDVVSASSVSAEYASSERKLKKTMPIPRALEDSEIEEIVSAFGEATRRAIIAGFDGIEIHGANRYLIHQFFSPHSNRREDRWGGSLQKRMAFPLAIVDAVKNTVTRYAEQPFLVGYRFSPEEPETPGITMIDTFKLVDALIEKQLDYLHVSILDFRSKPRRGVDATRTRLEWILERVANRVPVIGVGSIHTADDGLNVLKTGVSLIALGRELIVEPDWVEKIEQGQEAEIATTLTMNDRERLVIPEPLWSMMGRPGWFPFVNPQLRN